MRDFTKPLGHLLLAMTVALAFTVSVAGASKPGSLIPTTDVAGAVIPEVTIYDDVTGMRFTLVINSSSENFGAWTMFDPTTGEFHEGVATSMIFFKSGRVRATTAGEVSDTTMLMTANITYRYVEDATGGNQYARGTASVSCINPHIGMFVRDTRRSN
jgi:hypothetical protein